MSHDAYSALSDPTRRRILAALQDGARPVGELVTELEVSQPTVSKHLKVLRDARMVSTRAQGQKRFYSIAPEPLEEVVAWLGELVVAAADPAQGTTPPAPASEPVPPIASDDAEEGDRSPAAESAPERSVPWFTAEVTEVTEDEESGTGVVPAAVDDAPGAGVADHESGAPAVSDAQDEAAEHRAGLGEPDPAADRESEDLETAVEHWVETLPEEEAPVTAAKVDNDVPADARAQSGAVREAGPRDLAGPDPSESAELLRPRGGAHRRQSGLLSTLTGFRRRGRGTRRD
ncbi:metalloregulator ArsR/SmtB family transcription factor [Kocuria sp. KSNUG]|uniref:ArsR/SmtB family transcription factor n=1 Tax=Kocuria sp. KSNUG TaxID=3136676 RepID=UPI003C2E9317